MSRCEPLDILWWPLPARGMGNSSWLAMASYSPVLDQMISPDFMCDRLDIFCQNSYSINSLSVMGRASTDDVLSDVRDNRNVVPYLFIVWLEFGHIKDGYWQIVDLFEDWTHRVLQIRRWDHGAHRKENTDCFVFLFMANRERSSHKYIFARGGVPPNFEASLCWYEVDWGLGHMDLLGLPLVLKKCHFCCKFGQCLFFHVNFMPIRNVRHGPSGPYLIGSQYDDRWTQGELKVPTFAHPGKLGNTIKLKRINKGHVWTFCSRHNCQKIHRIYPCAGWAHVNTDVLKWIVSLSEIVFCTS